ncbi:hypothetical protein CALCODRAFT_479771 [Calocera cornea HHB12733]|uniref:Uncharacterized protein n=1 Tax=Calocera cornea HHB12733 TaxID=1353952 RepID=A0A165JEZ2_9BASI|nr:hypothetical protein CALCODRAFT_479771 [Calocera cornea HHB12733]
MSTSAAASTAPARKMRLYSKAPDGGRSKEDVQAAVRQVVSIFVEESLMVLNMYQKIEQMHDTRQVASMQRDIKRNAGIANAYILFYYLMDMCNAHPEGVKSLIDHVLNASRELRDCETRTPISDRDVFYVDMLGDNYLKHSDTFITRASREKRKLQGLLGDDGRLTLKIESSGKQAPHMINWDERLRLSFATLSKAVLDNIGNLPDMGRDVWKKSGARYCSAASHGWKSIRKAWKALKVGDMPGFLQVRLLEDALIARDCMWEYGVPEEETVLSAPYVPPAYRCFTDGQVPLRWQ